MTIYLAMLRGINVSGHKIIKMDNLKRIFESLEFEHVKTYIQSGNVIFHTAKKSTAALQDTIEKKLKEELGFEVTVFVKTMNELENVIKHNPYDVNEFKENEKIYVTFLSEEPAADAIDALQSLNNGVDEYQIHNREVYILIRNNNYGRSLFSNNFLEKKLKVLATTRNWQTVNKLVGLSRS